MAEECLICKAPLEYLETDVMMQCALCQKKELSKTRCVKGHYVCDECHSKGVADIMAVCLEETSRDPIVIIDKMMKMPFCHMHGPEHHTMVGAALLTAYKNAGGDIDLKNALLQMILRGKQVPGGVCGFWGACGAGISAGIFLSIVNKSSPLNKEVWGMGNRMTSAALAEIGKVDGPRCCKRDSFTAILAAIDFVKEHLGVEMERNIPVCTYSSMNNQCIGKKCPYCKVNHQ